MGNEVSRARVLAVSSVLTNFAVQTYCMVTIPNVKDIAEAVSCSYTISSRLDCVQC